MEYWIPNSWEEPELPLKEYLARRKAYGIWRVSDAGKRLVASKMKSQQRKCFYCECPLKPRAYELDHVQAVWKAGANHHSNYVLACKPCNRAKGANKVRQSAITARHKEVAEWRRDRILAQKIANAAHQRVGWF